jgi:ATP-dependent Clp protease ATP-binding subunit ClpC
MPKINVYLPDDLAAAVRAAGVPVSPVCQQALAQAVSAVNGARRAIAVIRDPQFEPAAHGASKLIRSRMTPRLAEALRIAGQAGPPGAHGRVGTAELLIGIIEQGDNMGLRLIEALGIEPGELAAALRQAGPAEPMPGGEAATATGQAAPADRAGAAAGAAAGTGEAGTASGAAAAAGPQDGGLREALTLPAWRASAGAAEAAIDLGHNYLGCEHLVIGLAAETGSTAGRVLAGLGVTPDGARKALASLVAGYAQGRQATLQAGAGALDEVLRRLDALEARVATLGSPS